MEGVELLVGVWNDWGIQALVSLSFLLQVLLLILADIRGRKDSGVLSAVLWSAYLLADTTAIYVLGHMSLISRSPEHQLMAFWAPFLLLHLGGQDNITAYSIEDNRLWLRHLQNFVIQVLAAAYVLYGSSIFGRQTMLRRATMLMFVVGVVKYGERVWALKCASSSTLSAGKNYRSFGGVRFEGVIGQFWKPEGEELGLRIAHRMLNIPKHVLKGPLPLVGVKLNLCCTWKEMYQVAEMQLSLMYDVFYSKAEVIHTWYGFCARVISLVATVAAFQLFHGFSEKDGYNRVDVTVTYVLLVGAILLEITSVLRAIFSSWLIRHLLVDGACELHLIFIPVVMVHRFVKFAMRKGGIHTRYWSGSMGQHNFIHMCTHSRGNRSSKIARWMGREDWWNTLAYTSSISVPANFSLLLKKTLYDGSRCNKKSPYHIQNSRGRTALTRSGLEEELAWSVDIELDESILVWNIATHVYLRWCKKEYLEQQSDLVEVTEALSNYTIFLLAARPDMLPDNVSRQRYIELCNKLINHSKYSSAEDLLKVIWDHGDALNTRPPPEDSPPVDVNGSILEKNKTFDRASQLGAKLIGKDSDMLELIAQVWMEMLCYAGYHCRPDSHVKRLSNGAEITTVVALMMEYIKSGPLLLSIAGET